MNAMLDGVRVAEVASSPAVRFCGHLLALAGAEVDRYASEANDATHLDIFLDYAKRVTGDPVPAELAEYDLLIADPDFDWQAVRAPQITGTVDGFAADGPRADWAAPEIVLASVGGATAYTHTPDGAPAYGFGNRFAYLAGQTLYIAVTAMIGAPAPRSDTAPRVRVSAAEVVVSLLPYATTQYAYNATTSTIEQSGPRFLVECVDGFLCVYAGGPWANIAAMLGDPALVDDRRFIEFGERFAHVDELDELVAKWARNQTVRDAVDAADRCSVAVAPCFDLDDVMADETLAANGSLRRVTVGAEQAVLPTLAMRERSR